MEQSSKEQKSIDRLTRLDIEWLLPGHGEAVHGAREIRKYLSFEQHWFPLLRGL
ncbi:MAG TPA: hypothetical protein PKJ77_10745 [Thermodesulfobacteriota bacterium]|nr:hypothetical protein [Thermodesulfobacteriota bacterium]HNU72001.1 hypothetical protein [Thermodesulfobacteriota bacterium]HOC39746.1 hypothetical protein [Thermodesulfobacteriota bacterium]